MSTKILLGFLIVTLIAPTVFLARPQKAEALVSLAQCLLAKNVARATAAAAAVMGAIASVSVSDAPATMEIGAGSGARDWVQCFMKGLVKIIAKTLLHTFTQSIVNWINTGFEGSPSFVTNPEGFLNDVADQTIGRVIEDISPLLCSPFKLDIRFALGLNLSLNSKEEVHCRLSDVISNVRGAYDSFVTGTIGSGNLSNWIHIAGTQSNNPYGAYIATTDIMSARIVSATGQQVKLLDWGNGFKSWRPCVERGPDIVVRYKEDEGTHKKGDPIFKADGTRVTRKSPCLKEGPIKTPGSIIQDQTTGALGTTLRELELASEIDEVVGALINQLLVKAMTGAGGLLGASKGDSSNGGISSIEALMTDPEAAIANADTRAPEGINCRLRYYPATVEEPKESKIYVPNDNNEDPLSKQVWTDNLGVGKTIGATATDNSPYIQAYYVIGKNGEILTDIKYLTAAQVREKEGHTAVTRGDEFETWEEYFDAVREGCSNEWNTLITNASTGALAKSPGGGSVTTGTPPPPSSTAPPPVSVNREISLAGAALNQSHIYVNPNTGQPHGPEQALYGYLWASTAGGGPGWWTASLNKIEEIKMIRFRTHEDPGFKIDSVTFSTVSNDKMGVPITREDVYAGENKITVYSSNPTPLISNVEKISDPLAGRDVTITFTTPIKANALAIYSATPYLALRSVKLYRPFEEPTDATPPEPQFAMTANPSQTITFKQGASTRGWNVNTLFGWNGISFDQNLPRENVTFRARLFTCQPKDLKNGLIPVACPDVTDNAYTVQQTPFVSHFSSLLLNYWINGVETSKSMIENVGGYTYTRVADVPANAPENGISFAQNINLQKNSPVQISVLGTMRNNLPFDIVIDAIDSSTNTILSSVRAKFIR